MLARADEASPVWGPARLEDAILRPGYRPTCLVAEDIRTRLAMRGVNTLQAVRSVGRIGAKPRTLARGTAGAPDWQSLAARRLALFIVNSIEHGTRWVRSAEPEVDVVEAVSTQTRTFFGQLHEAGAFPGRRIEDAFFVMCDPRLNSPDAACANEFRFLIGFAAARATEFHTFRISQSASGGKVQSVSFDRGNLAEFSPRSSSGWRIWLASSSGPRGLIAWFRACLVDGGLFPRQGKRPMGQQDHRYGGRGARDWVTRSNRWIIAAWMIPVRGSRCSSPPPLERPSRSYWWDRAWVATCRRPRLRWCGRAALFLLAPAFYMPGFEAYTPQDVACPTAIVHGWRDAIVPVENSIRWAREHGRRCTCSNSDHRLEDRIPAICALLRIFWPNLSGF